MQLFSTATFLHAIFYHSKGNSEETQQTPAQVILIKLGQMAEGKILELVEIWTKKISNMIGQFFGFRLDRLLYWQCY